MEPMFPKWTQIGVCLVISTIVGALEGMWTWFTFFCLEVRGVIRQECGWTLARVRVSWT